MSTPLEIAVRGTGTISWYWDEIVLASALTHEQWSNEPVEPVSGLPQELMGGLVVAPIVSVHNHYQSAAANGPPRS